MSVAFFFCGLRHVYTCDTLQPLRGSEYRHVQCARGRNEFDHALVPHIWWGLLNIPSQLRESRFLRFPSSVSQASREAVNWMNDFSSLPGVYCVEYTSCCSLLRVQSCLSAYFRGLCGDHGEHWLWKPARRYLELRLLPGMGSYPSVNKERIAR